MAATVRQVTICGFGLIGGSIALDLLKGRHKLKLVAFDRPAILKRLKSSRRFPVKIEGSLKDAVAGSDVVILATTHKANRLILSRLSKVKSLTNCLIIDTGAVKSPIAELGREMTFPEGTNFVPSHPMAGREKAGFENAAQGLFADHAWYLDSDVKLGRPLKARLDWMIKKLKARPVYISSADHDLLVSEISHLPQLISTLLGAQVDHRTIELAGPGLRSMLRLAGSPYSVWSEIIDENRQEISEALTLYSENLQRVIRMIKKQESLSKIFSEAARSYECL